MKYVNHPALFHTEYFVVFANDSLVYRKREEKKKPATKFLSANMTRFIKSESIIA